MSKVGRNHKCPCGSGIKFKRCCLRNPTAAEDVRSKLTELFSQLSLSKGDEGRDASSLCLFGSYHLQAWPFGPTLVDTTKIWLNLGSGLESFEPLLEVACEMLDRAGHLEPYTDKMKRERFAGIVLAMAIASTNSPADILEAFRVLVGSVSETLLRQVLVSDVIEDGEQQYKFGNFTYGPFGGENEIAARYSKTQAFDRWESELAGKRSLTLDIESIATINPLSLMRWSKFSESKLFLRIFDEYFYDINNLMWVPFFDALENQQAAQNIMAGLNVSKSLFMTSSGVAQQMTYYSKLDDPVFTWTSKMGYGRSLLPPRDAWTRVADTVQTNLRLMDLGSLPLDDRLEEGILHMVFAIDRLVGAKQGQPITNSFKLRVAALAHIPLKTTFAELKKDASNAYDFRSNFAHRGGLIGTIKMAQDGHRLKIRFMKLFDICRVLFASACWARRQTWCDNRESWLVRVDLLVDALQDGRDTDSLVRDLGLSRIHSAEFEDAQQMKHNQLGESHSVSSAIPFEKYYRIVWKS